ncbi:MULTISPECIES: beta-N-acetylhexosaminidase [Mucilaginibacter]|nr:MULTISPECIES: family 20 glycosylhydrolase [Mucilaginibacter]QTE40669.1 family 20 glycosylhydrolase [Mucilaginibacter rubeus]QTE47271.1 family 20 glycosylhydrolase [Mucilaginibacter rubeus]QTE58664.1 family 20 glycosylhydrolase [Mucilaginibacter rubeus]QTE61877.1 family 20 glycosylhydrolase [Mucilaginibacter rubeus]QTF60634.1 family 20 glycosylhydrolase [Mucilaginibacter rubeus]
MRTILITILSLLTISAFAQESAPLNLMPIPSRLQRNNGKFRITEKLTVSVSAEAKDSVLYRAVNRAYKRLNSKTAALFGQQYITPNDTLKNAVMQIKAASKTLMKIGIDESYKLTIDNSHINLTAPNTIGVLRGLQTLIQLCSLDGDGYYFPCVSITDAPRFQWRGIMIDVARHFISVDEIERNIDAMATVKMNILHWHLTDDEGFRVESKLFPLLQAKGSNGDYYTQAQLREVVQYASDRGIIVEPEFDMPGHSQSWFAGYPELASRPGPYRPGPRSQWMQEHPDPNRPKNSGPASVVNDLEGSTFDATNEKVYKFLDKFIGEMTSIFPAEYVHIGADENNGLAWKLNPKIADWMTKHKMQSTDDLERYFVSRIYDILKKHHKQMVGWEEIYNNNGQLPKDAIVHKWIPPSLSKFVKSHGTADEFASHGYGTILSEGFYLDVFMPASFHYTNPVLMQETSPKILGGEAAQWAEMIDNENASLRVWPRAGAIAERLWSPVSVSDVDDMYRRLFILREQLSQQGLLNIYEYDRALGQIVDKENVVYLKTLVDVLTPINGYMKAMGNMMKSPALGYQTTPLTFVSDFVACDSETQKKFRALVKVYLENHDKSVEEKIRWYLIQWQNNQTHLDPLFAGNRRLLEIQNHSKNLASAAAIGLEALTRADKSTEVDNAWVQKNIDLLNSYTTAHAETKLAIISEVSSLVSGKLIDEPKASVGF